MLVKATKVSKSFAGVHALQGVSFDLRAGEVHALVGENGAGKSTLIKIITGAHQADEGRSKSMAAWSPRMTPSSRGRWASRQFYQQPALFPDLTVAENIALGLEPGGWLAPHPLGR